MPIGILKRNTRDRRKEAESRLIEIIEETLRGKSDEEQADIINEFNEYLKDGGLDKVLNMGKRTRSKIRFNSGTINRNNSRLKTSRGTQKINLNNTMSHKRRNAKNNVIGQTLGSRI